MSSMTAESEKYNGWANYPTWAVNLWLSNEEGLYNEALEVTREALRNDANAEWQKVGVANSLKQWVRYELPDLGASMAADLLGYAFDHVEWDEIAEAFIEVVEDSTTSEP